MTGLSHLMTVERTGKVLVKRRNTGYDDHTMKKIPLGKYRHYKGHEYLVLGLARHSETLEELIVYKALHSSPEYGPNQLWVRPLKMFFETVLIDGKKIPRFKFLEEE